ncbi:hypothetical protein E2562_002993 [Oryza meyeriana var. granulata]|uniref:Legume lectin domain-containing protein n=1 Tax=Oryza meyeriana var. granulata TaxID=110450 RepID=A0A6G1DDR0_9ORYZ|nr:hypothetical protein E2562_002993 [Oryza meyeriana var. granulata]
METVDPRLRNGYVKEEVELVLKLGLLCSHPLASARPSMRQVVHYLNGDMEFPELNTVQVGFSMTNLLKNEGPNPDAMSPISSFLVPSVFHCINLVASSASVNQFAFEGFAGANLSLEGAATVTPSGLLKLTNDKHTKGRAFYPIPICFHSPPNGGATSATFVFAIVSDHAKLSDHGLAFLVAPSKSLSATTRAQYLGLMNISDNGKASNHVFSVELDTVLSPELHDIDRNHVGIDVNSLQSVQSHTAGYYDDSAGAFMNLTLMSRKVMQVWEDYNGQHMVLNVTLAPLDVSKPKKPLLSTSRR